jgi:hypothetical protein
LTLRLWEEVLQEGCQRAQEVPPEFKRDVVRVARRGDLSQAELGGAFDTAGVESWASPAAPGFPASHLATWHFTTPDGTWSTPGAADRPVKALAALDDRTLLIGGGFSSIGPVDASAVVEHDPATGAWTTYGSGIGWGARGVRQVEALAQGPDAGLWVGGTFTVAGAVPHCGLALWRGTVGRTPQLPSDVDTRSGTSESSGSSATAQSRR